MMQLTLTARSGYGCRWDDINQTAGHEANRGYISGVVKAIVVDGRREFATEREVAKMEKAGDEKTTVVDASEKRGADVLGRDDVATDTTSEGEYESAVSGADVTEVRLIGTECACQAARWAHKWLVKDTEWWCEGDAMKEAVEDGDEVFVKWHLENCKTNDSRWLMPLAASFGHVGILVLLLERGLSFNAKVVMESTGAAAEHGQVPVLRWFHENIMERWSSDVMDKAAMHGHLDAVRWLHENRREGCTTNAIYEAAMGGHFEVVKWLHHNRPDDCKETAMTGAAQNGHIDIVKWLHENRTEGCTTNAMDGAAKNGHLEVVQWLHKNRKEGCTTYAMDAAAGYGHLNVVQWLHNHRSEGCSIEGMRLATVNGHKDIVKWLQEHRDECRTKAPDLVIQTPIKAQEGRPMPQSIDDAADSGHWHMVEQLLRSPSAVYGASILAKAIEHRQLHIVKALYDRNEFRSWPRPDHTGILIDLIRSKGVLPRKILQHITSRRKERYDMNARDNPSNAEFSELRLKPRQTEDERCRSFPLSAVSKVCTHLNLSDEAEALISEFIMGDPSSRFCRADAADRGFVYWLLQFSENLNEDIRVLAGIGNHEGARVIHDHLKQNGTLLCSDHFKYSTMETGSLEFAQWHIRNCSDHSTDSWVYLAVWIGRVDVIDWMCEHQAEVASVMRTFPYSLDASFSTVESRYDLDSMAIEAWMDELEQDDQDEALLSESERRDMLLNVFDLASTNGGYKVYLACRKKSKDVPGCSVGGLYGAIVYGQLDFVKMLYDYQPYLAKWPKDEDGARLLRKILSLDRSNCKAMLAFFRQKRNMLLEPSDLYDAVFRGDLKCVQLICELDLVDWTSITTYAMDVAAVRGDYKMLKLLHSTISDLRCSHRALNGAAEEGHLDVVKYLHRQGAPYKGMALDLAAKNGRLAVVQYLWEHQENDCSLYTMLWATGRNNADNLRTVRYLASKYASCDVDKCMTLARNQGNEEVFAILEVYRKTNLMRKPRLSTAQLRRRKRSQPILENRYVHSDRTVYCELVRHVWKCDPQGGRSLVPVPPVVGVYPSRLHRHRRKREKNINYTAPQSCFSVSSSPEVMGCVDMGDCQPRCLDDRFNDYSFSAEDFYDLDYRGRWFFPPSLPGLTSTELTIA